MKDEWPDIIEEVRTVVPPAFRLPTKQEKEVDWQRFVLYWNLSIAFIIGLCLGVLIGRL